jgi:hypothetical protein
VIAVATADEVLRGPSGGRVPRNLIDLFASAMYEAVLGETRDRSVPLFLTLTERRVAAGVARVVARG